MIKGFKHRGLKQLFKKGNAAGIAPSMSPRLQRVLDAVDRASSPLDLMIPGFETHQLKGDRKGTWSITITGNWRITFKFEGLDVVQVNLEDYH